LQILSENAKPYEQATFPGQKVQIDVKVVPSVCIVGQAKEQGEKMYQYTAIDECTRFRFIAAFKEQSTYSSMRFLQQLIRRFPFKIHKVQTDNGAEFTKRFQAADEENLTLFEKELKRLGIAHQMMISIVSPPLSVLWCCPAHDFLLAVLVGAGSLSA